MNQPSNGSSGKDVPLLQSERGSLQSVLFKTSFWSMERLVSREVLDLKRVFVEVCPARNFNMNDGFPVLSLDLCDLIGIRNVSAYQRVQKGAGRPFGLTGPKAVYCMRALSLQSCPSNIYYAWQSTAHKFHRRLSQPISIANFEAHQEGSDLFLCVFKSFQ